MGVFKRVQTPESVTDFPYDEVLRLFYGYTQQYIPF